MTCPHNWVGQTHVSSNAVQRYQCSTCKRWGYRNFSRTRFSPIRAYVSEATEPDPTWNQWEGSMDSHIRNNPNFKKVPE